MFLMEDNKFFDKSFAPNENKQITACDTPTSIYGYTGVAQIRTTPFKIKLA